MTTSLPTTTQRLVLNNIGMTLLARVGENFFEVSHAGRFAQTTDELLSKTQGFIAHCVTDNTNTVVATFIAKELVITNKPEVADLNRAGSDYTQLYMLRESGLYQIAKIVFEDPEQTDKEKAQDLAVMQGNHFMEMNPDTALIASAEMDGSNEVPRLHFIASKEPVA